jgi:hypothetical protein
MYRNYMAYKHQSFKKDSAKSVSCIIVNMVRCLFSHMFLCSNDPDDVLIREKLREMDIWMDSKIGTEDVWKSRCASGLVWVPYFTSSNQTWHKQMKINNCRWYLGSVRENSKWRKLPGSAAQYPKLRRLSTDFQNNVMTHLHKKIRTWVQDYDKDDAYL